MIIPKKQDQVHINAQWITAKLNALKSKETTLRKGKKKWEREYLVVCDWERLMSSTRANKKEFIHKGSNGRAHKWAKPVDPVAVPWPTHHCWPKGNSWVHGCTIKGTTSQNVGTHYEPNGYWCYDPYVPPFRVHCCGVHCVNQSESHHYLKHHRVPHVHAWWQCKCWCFL